MASCEHGLVAMNVAMRLVVPNSGAAIEWAESVPYGIGGALEQQSHGLGVALQN